MANKKITELNEATSVSGNDWLVIVDVANDETKKVHANQVGGNIPIQDTAPQDPEEDDLWIDTSEEGFDNSKVVNEHSTSISDAYSCNYVNDLTKTTKTTSDSNTYSCNYINGILNGVCPASFNDKASINITSVNGYGVAVLFSTMYGALVQFQGSGNNPNVITIYGTPSFTTSASGNVVTLSSLNTWDHYIMLGSSAISKIE